VSFVGANGPVVTGTHPPYDILARIAVAVVVVIPGRAARRAQHVSGAGKGAAGGTKRSTDDRTHWTVGCIAARCPAASPETVPDAGFEYPGAGTSWQTPP
jgi:hypothetical protein